MLNRTIAPEIKEPVDFKISLPGCQKYTLSNGIEVYAVDMGSEETLMVNWVFYAGNWYEDSKAVAAATNFLLKNGTSKRKAFDINEHFEYHGAYLNRGCYNETAELTLHCLNKHTNELLPVVAELITDAVFPEEELAIYKQNAQQRLKVNLQKCEFVAGRLIDAYLFGEKHPYGTYNNAEDYDAIRREDIVAFYDKYYRNGRCVIFAAGKLPADLISELEKHFGSLPLHSHQQHVTIVKHPVHPAPQKKSHIINDTTGVQAAIRIARPFPNRQHPDFQKTMVLNSLFGGFFGSRLMTNIREDKGYTYGIYSYLLNHINDSGWMISTEAGRDVSEATVTEVYNEMALLREEPVDDEELLMTRNYMIGSILGDLDGPFQVIGRWKNLVLNNLDEEYFNNGLQVIRTVTAEELQELANKYLQPEDFYELVVI
ncbi:MAG: insulinase family protein [Niastella sp.]|nr:insulinase family protein [Niastella sp.]